MKKRIFEAFVAVTIWTAILLWNLGWFVTRTVLQVSWWFVTQWSNIDNKKNDFVPWWDREVDPTRKG